MTNRALIRSILSLRPTITLPFNLQQTRQNSRDRVMTLSKIVYLYQLAHCMNDNKKTSNMNAKMLAVHQRPRYELVSR